jgi:sulfur carrier protein
MTESPPNETAVVVNGETVNAPAGSSLATVLLQRGIHVDTPGVAVALGDEVISRSAWATTIVYEGAAIEIVTAVQGG